MRRKDGGRTYHDRKRENISRDVSQMDRQLAHQGGSSGICNQPTFTHQTNMGTSNDMTFTLRNCKSTSIPGSGRMNIESTSKCGGNLNEDIMGNSRNLSMRVAVSTNMDLVGSGMSNMNSMPMQISPTSQPQWGVGISQSNLSNISSQRSSMGMSASTMSCQMNGIVPSQVVPTQTSLQSQIQGFQQSIIPSMTTTNPESTLPMISGINHMNGMVSTVMEHSATQMAPPWNMSTMVGPDGCVVKQPITYRMSILYPPNPQAPPPTTRERPPGCRTVFIGGLPENATEEHVVDIFSKCGEIQTVRMSKKNFCHIRYVAEFCVDNAIYFSGWRMRIENSSDGPNTGRLHVDFAQVP